MIHGSTISAIALAVAVVIAAWVIGDGRASLVYLLLYGLATLPGWPIGFALFGRRHAAGWIAGALLGYGLTALACWFAIALRQPTVLGFVAAWALMTALTWGIPARHSPRRRLPADSSPITDHPPLTIDVSQTTDHRSPTTDDRPPTTAHRRLTTDGSQTTDHRSSITDRSSTIDHRPPANDFGSLIHDVRSLTPDPGPLVTLPSWTRRDACALFLVLLMVPAAFALPYRNIGRVDREGTQYYRAYFTADFIWHTALTAELTKYDMPPVNPYLGDRPLNYYWMYFLLPAAISGTHLGPFADVERCLKLNAFLSGLLFIAAIFIVVWSAAPVALAAGLAVALAVLAASLEGLYELYDLYKQGLPLGILRDLNIDAVSSWRFGGLRIDSLVRSMWYNPQHSMAAALGLIALPVAGTVGAAAPLAAGGISGLALGFATAMSPFVGGTLAAVYGIAMALDAIRQPGVIRRIARASVAGVPVVLALGWCVENSMFERAGGTVLLGFHGLARHAPFVTLGLSVGPILVVAIAGLWPFRRIPLRVWPAIVGTVLALALFYLVSLSVEASYVGFRAGQLLQLCLAVLLGHALARLSVNGRLSRVGIVAVVLVAILAFPTTAVDVYNAQDIGNRNMGPGFRWTVTLSPDERAAFTWIRQNVPPRAIVQMDPIGRDPETWSFIPTFAGRRMAAGLPISLIRTPEYFARSQLVEQMYSTADSNLAAQIAESLRIDYVYVGRVERERFNRESLAKFDPAAGYFDLAFQNDEVQVYGVRDRTRSRGGS